MEFAEVFSTLGQFAGLTSFTLLGILIISGDTARFFDRFIGMDRIIKFQRKFATFTFAMILSHPLFFIISDQAFGKYLIPNYQILPLAIGITAFYLIVLVMLASKFYKSISHTAWQYIHIVTYLIFLAVLYHALNWGSHAGNILAQTLYGVLGILVLAGLIFRAQYKIRKIFGGDFIVKEVKQETADTYSLVITPEKPFNFKAGQFCFLRIPKEKLHARHPFTICSAPGEKDLKFTIKKAGRFTEAALRLKKGEKISVDGPFGRFYIRNYKKKLVFIAGGVGITPFMSMINDQIAKGRQQKICLLYGSRTAENIIFQDELSAIKEDWFTKAYILSDEAKAAKGYEKGHITGDIIKKYAKDPTSYLFYICGPELMKTSIKETLKKMGVKNNQIFSEDFFW